MILISLSYILFFCGYSSAHSLTVEDCGKTSAVGGRIVGGRPSKAGAHPWMVSLEQNGIFGFEAICGGAVLNENWILTAAHCVELTTQPEKYQVLVGLHRLSNPKASTVQKIKISKIVAHEDYSDETEVNDIALLKTTKPIDIAGSKGYVNGICLPKKDAEPKGYVTVTGWGYQYEDGYPSNTLKEVKIPVIPRDLCNGAYDSDLSDETDEVVETMFCAGMANKDSCQMDSGGPLFQKDSEGTATLVGIVSHGFGCGERYYPGVNTKVSSFTDWIKNVVTSE